MEYVHNFNCCLSEREKLDLQAKRDIEKILRREKKKLKSEFKLLLLGTGEAGKSTFVKQMRIIHGQGYTSDQRKEFIYLIFKNILTSIQILACAMDLLDIDYESRECKIFAMSIGNIEPELLHWPEQRYLLPIKTIWKDAGIMACYSRRREYQISDSTEYYFNHIDRIFSKDYIPTEQDILRVRAPTSGVIDHSFEIENVNFKIVDVGGQRSERRKWLHHFDNVTSILFLVALSEYDQVLLEANDTNRMEESKYLFKYIVQCKWFQSASIVLFLNKKDIFAEKIMNSNLSDYFPDYSGPKHDNVAAQIFICDMFYNLAEQKQMYSHYTCATDTENIKNVFKAVKNTIMINNLRTLEV